MKGRILVSVFTIRQNNLGCLQTTKMLTMLLTKQLRSNYVHDTEKKLSKITISFSTGQQENLNSLLFTVSNIIYSTQIEIHSAFFTSSEIVLILEDSNATELYDSLRKELTAGNPNLA